MFDGPGTLYVYRSYGIHWCMNVVVREEGVPHAVLLRGGAPVEGRGVMVERRRREDHLTTVPGNYATPWESQASTIERQSSTARYG